MNPKIDPRFQKTDVTIAPALYDKTFEKIAKPSGITVEQAVNQLLAMSVDNNLAGISTKALADELAKREGVEKYTVDTCHTLTVELEGTDVVLIITD